MKPWNFAVSMLSAAALACFAACSNNSGGSGGGSGGDAGPSSGGEGGASSDASASSSGSGSGSGSGSSSGSSSGSDSGSGGPSTCEVETNHDYFVCASGQTGYYCVGSDTPVQDGYAHSCSQPSPDQTGLGFDYCCQ
jgi:hypothetical protein